MYILLHSLHCNRVLTWELTAPKGTFPCVVKETLKGCSRSLPVLTLGAEARNLGSRIRSTV